MKYYLAYGSNLNKEQMGYRCPGAIAVGTAVLENYTLMFKGSGTGAYLTIEPKFGESVEVGVWEINERDERLLDRYEGFPAFYYKKDVSVAVTLNDGDVKDLPAFVYIMRENRPYGLPSDKYVETCLAGFKDFGFNLDNLGKALELSTGKVL